MIIRHARIPPTLQKLVWLRWFILSFNIVLLNGFGTFAPYIGMGWCPSCRYWIRWTNTHYHPPVCCLIYEFCDSEVRAKWISLAVETRYPSLAIYRINTFKGVKINLNKKITFLVTLYIKTNVHHIKIIRSSYKFRN